MANKIRRPISFPGWAFLAVPVFITFILWVRNIGLGFNIDDYGMIDVQSPIRGVADAIRMFWTRDPTSTYWRPFLNSTVSIDFLLWGWNGGMFHLTNLLMHLAAVILVYLMARRIFSFSEFSAGALAFIFGVSGSHSSNLLWLAARSDLLAALLMMIVILCEYAAQRSVLRRTQWLLISWFVYILAITSKEGSAVLIILLPILVYSSTPKELWNRKFTILPKLIPYIIITGIFLYFHSLFTVPLGELPPLTAEGGHSFAAFIKNTLYTIGFIAAPLDFRQASLVIGKYAVWGYISAAVGFCVFLFFFIRILSKEVLLRLYRPFCLFLFTVFVSFLSFERWRVYFPSIGFFAILIILWIIFWQKAGPNKTVRTFLIVVAFVFSLFHFEQSVADQNTWLQATSIVRDLEKEMAGILAAHKQRPLTIELITSPTKLGGAPLLQMSRDYFAIEAEADIRNAPDREFGVLSIPGDSVDLNVDLQLFALDPEAGFRDLVIKRIGEKTLEISGDETEIGLFPEIELTNGKARRDAQFSPGQTFRTFGTDITMENVSGGFASKVLLTVRDTSALHLYFDGKRIRELP